MKFSKSIAAAGIFAGTFVSALFAVAGAAHANAATITTTTTSAGGVVAVASAATVATTDECGLTAADVAKIAAIQNDTSLSWSQEVKQELAMRKQLVAKTVSCAQADVTSLQKALAATQTNSDAAKNIQSQLQSRLSDAANFYTLELSKLDDSGILGSESIAREILAWRAGTYAPLSGQTANFILWAQNQNLFSTAQTRMNQTQQAVSFFENASANTDLQNAFNEAYASFQTAKDDNASAQTALAQSLSPDQSLTRIKKSLDALSTTYEKFSSVSDIIKKLLPQ